MLFKQKKKSHKFSIIYMYFFISCTLAKTSKMKLNTKVANISVLFI